MRTDTQSLLRDSTPRRDARVDVPTRTVRHFQTNLTDNELAEKQILVLSSPTKFMKLFAANDAEWASGIPILISSYQGLVRQNPDQETVAPRKWIAKFNARLENLRQISVDEELPFSDISYHASQQFVNKVQWAILPSVFLIGNGNIRLLWDNEVGEQVGLQFVGNDKVQYVFFQNSGDQVDPVMGTKKASQILALIDRLGLRHVMTA
ncbi:MAG: hypothetical protein ABIQ66_05450 [Novosphingobium sp.]